MLKVHCHLILFLQVHLTQLYYQFYESTQIINYDYSHTKYQLNSSDAPVRFCSYENTNKMTPSEILLLLDRRRVGGLSTTSHIAARMYFFARAQSCISHSKFKLILPYILNRCKMFQLFLKRHQFSTFPLIVLSPCDSASI